MKLKIILIISILSFFVKNKVHSQTIEIRYHLGYSCGKEVNGKKIRGGCVTNERMNYSFIESKKYFKSKELKVQREFRQYKNGEFGENLEKDSLTVFKISRKVSFKEFDKLMNLVSLIENGKDKKSNSIEYFKKEIISKWNKETFELSKWEIRKIKKIASAENVNLSADSLIQKIKEYIED